MQKTTCLKKFMSVLHNKRLYNSHGFLKPKKLRLLIFERFEPK